LVRIGVETIEEIEATGVTSTFWLEVRALEILFVDISSLARTMLLFFSFFFAKPTKSLNFSKE